MAENNKKDCWQGSKKVSLHDRQVFTRNHAGRKNKLGDCRMF